MFSLPQLFPFFLYDGVRPVAAGYIAWIDSKNRKDVAAAGGKEQKACRKKGKSSTAGESYTTDQDKCSGSFVRLTLDGLPLLGCFKTCQCFFLSSIKFPFSNQFLLSWVKSTFTKLHIMHLFTSDNSSKSLMDYFRMWYPSQIISGTSCKNMRTSAYHMMQPSLHVLKFHHEHIERSRIFDHPFCSYSIDSSPSSACISTSFLLHCNLTLNKTIIQQTQVGFALLIRLLSAKITRH